MVDRKLRSCLTPASSSTSYAITAIRVGSLGCNRSYAVTCYKTSCVVVIYRWFIRCRGPRQYRPRETRFDERPAKASCAVIAAFDLSERRQALFAEQQINARPSCCWIVVSWLIMRSCLTAACHTTLQPSPCLLSRADGCSARPAPVSAGSAPLRAVCLQARGWLIYMPPRRVWIRPAAPRARNPAIQNGC
jgi:hypothetical protein